MLQFERSVNLDEDCAGRGSESNPGVFQSTVVFQEFVKTEIFSHSLLDQEKQDFAHTSSMKHPIFMPFLMPAITSQQEDSDTFWWLIDSGASASVVSSKFIDSYEVHQVMDLPMDNDHGFSSASGEIIRPSRMVCIKAHFKMLSIHDPKHKIWQDCLITAFVANAPNNVLSLGTLLRKGWTLGSSGSEVQVIHDDFRLDIDESSKHDMPATRLVEWFKTSSVRPQKSKAGSQSSKQVRFGEPHVLTFEREAPLLMAAKRKAETELSPETVYRSLDSQPQITPPIPADRNVAGESGTAEQSGQDSSSFSGSGIGLNEPNLSDMQVETSIQPPGLPIPHMALRCIYLTNHKIRQRIQLF